MRTLHVNGFVKLFKQRKNNCGFVLDIYYFMMIIIVSITIRLLVICYVVVVVLRNYASRLFTYHLAN